MKCKRCKNIVDLSHSKSLCIQCLESGKIRSRKSRIKTGFIQRRKELGLQALSKGLCKFCLINPIYTLHSEICCEHCFYNRKKSNIKYRKSIWQEPKPRKVQTLEEQKQKDKIYREANRYKLNLASRNWQQNNQERRKNNIKTWLLKNPSKPIEYSERRRVRKINAIGDFTAKEFEDLKLLYKNKCLWCGEFKKLSADHVVPLSRGGTNSIDNIQPLCLHCNQKKNTKIFDFKSFGSSILEWT